MVTDRASVHDVNLPWFVPHKGTVLNAMDVWWRQQLAKIIPLHDLMAYGQDIDGYLPVELRGNSLLQSRGRIIQQIDMFPIECVIRGRCLSKAWEAAKDGKPICGQMLPEGLKLMSPLDPPIFTPTDKGRDGGHDEPVDIRLFEMFKRNDLRDLAMALFLAGRDIAASRGLELIDTKFEMGLCDGELCVADEVLTVDASRFASVEEAAAAYREGRNPRSLDKQRLRDWITERFGLTAKTVLDSPQGIDIVQAILEAEAPTEIIEEVSDTYLRMFTTLTGHASPYEFLGVAV